MGNAVTGDKGVFERMQYLGDQMAEIAKHYFGFELYEQRTMLLCISFPALLDMLENERERVRPFMGHHDLDEGAEAARAWLDELRSTDAAMQAQTLCQRVRPKPFLAEMLKRVASWSALEYSYYGALLNDDQDQATECALTAAQLFGEISEMDRQYSTKIEAALKGAAGREATMGKRRAHAMAMYEARNLHNLSAIAAAEMLRRDGASISIDRLAREISNFRKKRGLDTKTRANAPTERVPDTKETSSD